MVESSKVDPDSGAAEQSKDATIQDSNSTVGKRLAKQEVCSVSTGKLDRQYREPEIALGASFGECAIEVSTETESAVILESAP